MDKPEAGEASNVEVLLCELCAEVAGLRRDITGGLRVQRRLLLVQAAAGGLALAVFGGVLVAATVA
jgi:hypothetical protein